MEFNIFFTDEALEDLNKLDEKNIKRIIKKLKWFSKQNDPLAFAKALKYDAIGEYRFRVGDYRVIFDVKKSKIIILRVGHRSSIYK